MKSRPYLKYLFASVLILLAILYWANDTYSLFSTGKAQAEPSALSQALNACQMIADKSVADMKVVVDYQKLEIAGRRIRVLQNCMDDHGFVENSAWLEYAQPIASHDAQMNQTSENEAFENLRRLAMEKDQAQNNAPLYWLAKAEAKK